MGQIPLVTLTTDFGTADGYVGTMRGVILNIVPNAQLIDISHQISPQDVRQAAYVLYAAYAFFSPHTVHLVVVDPGVGSVRRSIALCTPVGCFVGPDNGVFSYVMAREPIEELVELTNPRYQLPVVGHTFHGRDVFAPAAAHLAAGVPITAFGPPIDDPITLPSPRLEITPGNAVGEVLHIDHFGNVITSIGLLAWCEEKDILLLDPVFKGIENGKRERLRFEARGATVAAAGREIAGVHRTFAQVECGQVLALVGSSGHLEIAVREGSAIQRLGLQLGDVVSLSV
jgi:S-adenosylmethionine hydrolase